MSPCLLMIWPGPGTGAGATSTLLPAGCSTCEESQTPNALARKKADMFDWPRKCTLVGCALLSFTWRPL